MVVGGIATLLVVACLAAVFRSEFEAWMPWLAERLRRLALKLLKGDLRERLDEEWQAYLSEVPGFVGKVVCALGFNIAASQIALRSRFSVVAGWAISKALRLSIAFGNLGLTISSWILSGEGEFLLRTRLRIAKVLTANSKHFVIRTASIARMRARFIEAADDRAKYTMAIEAAYCELAVKLKIPYRVSSSDT